MDIKKEIRQILFKTQIFQLIHRYSLDRRLSSIPIEQLRCQKMPFSELLGFSGRPINFFPPCQFYELALSNPEQAQAVFFKWMYKCLIDKQAYKVAQSEGGWRNGSLVRTIISLHHHNKIVISGIEEADPVLLNDAIHSRVKHYFSILDSINKTGYDRAVYPPVYCLKNDGYYAIKNGHHRISAMWTLGYKQVDVVLMRK